MSVPQMPSCYDKRRWVRDKHGALGYLGSNGHTFIGRFLTFWDRDLHPGGYSTSLNELAECSAEAADWLRGFFTGSEPPPPWSGEEHLDDEQVELWRAAIAAYHLTGTWAPARVCEECGAELLPSSPPGLRCSDHGGEIVSLWPTVIES